MICICSLSFLNIVWIWLINLSDCIVQSNNQQQHHRMKCPGPVKPECYNEMNIMLYFFVLIEEFALNWQIVGVNSAVLLLQKQASLTQTSGRWIKQTCGTCFLESRTSRKDIICLKKFIKRWTNQLSNSTINDQQSIWVILYFVFQQSAGSTSKTKSKGTETFKSTIIYFLFFILSSCLFIHSCKVLLFICLFVCLCWMHPFFPSLFSKRSPQGNKTLLPWCCQRFGE